MSDRSPALAPESARQAFRPFLGATLLALVLRLAFVVLEPPTRPVGDELTWIGWSIQSPAGVASPEVRFSPLKTGVLFNAPAYAYFVGSLYAIFGTLTAVKLAQCLVGALLVPLVGRLGAGLAGPAAGRLAAFVTAFYPDLIWFSAHFWSETLLLTLLYAAIERTLAADHTQSRRTALVAGALWGASILTRETALYFTPLVALWLVGRRPTRHSRACGLAFGLTAVLVVAPWTLRNYVVFKALIPVSTAGGLNLWQGNALLSRQEVYDRYYPIEGLVAQYETGRREGWRAIRARQPSWLFEKLRDELPLFWEADNLTLVHLARRAYTLPDWVRPATAVVTLAPYLALLPLFVLGLTLVPWNARHALLAAFLAYYNLIHVVTHGFARYRLPIMPIVFVFATLGYVAFRDGRLNAEPRRRALAVLVGIVLALSVAPSLLAWFGSSGGGAEN